MPARADPANLEARIQIIGGELYRAAARTRPALFDPLSLRGRVLARAIRDDALRAALFQFIDVLPQLESAHDIAAHFHAYLSQYRLAGAWGRLLRLGSQPLAAWAVRASVARLAHLFLVEETEPALRRVLAALARIPATATVDAVGETVLTEAEADAYCARNLDLLRWLEAAGATKPSLSIKLSALTARFDPIDPDATRSRVLTRIAPLMAEVVRSGASLTLDMEQDEYKPLILELFQALACAYPDPGWLPGVALQAYRPDALQDLEQLIAWARHSGRRIGVRLVKGAYWDTEVALARQRNWPLPVYLDKRQTDAAFERLAGLLMEHTDAVYPAFGTHNLRSLACVLALAEAHGLSAAQWEVQMLYGMAEPLRDAVAARGAPLRVYLPSGELIGGIAYLIRRLLENTATTSILRQEYAEGAAPETLLAAPRPPVASAAPGTADFVNTPLTDFSRAAPRAALRAALTRVRGELGRHLALAIPGAPEQGIARHAMTNPARSDEVLASVEVAGLPHAERAVANAVAAFPGWRDTPAARRIELCRRAADLLHDRRLELAAWEVLEVGKNWVEADADVAEAIDYFRYYALEMERLAGWHPTVIFPGERNHWRYEPCGVATVIAPWNFPLAILAGMTAAALVTGNPVIMKPAGPARLIAWQLHRILLEAGFPAQVCQLLPAQGELVGAYLVRQREVAVIAFTGSREVGLNILEQAHHAAPGQNRVKRVVCEMGGKNAIIVDEDADLDEAVIGILASAFGYQGQKCSACSRLIAVGRIHDRLVARLAAALDAFELGAPEFPGYALGPLITRQAVEKASRYLDIGQAEGRLYYQGRAPAGGHYFAPAIFTDIQPHHRLAREEIFAPILAVLRAPDFEAALALAQDCDYGLSGGVYSRLPAHLELARERYRVGDLYLNRRITGARVGIQPFGGVKLSGSGVQAGGPDYLRQFLWSRLVSENVLRHGFVPPE